MEGEDCPSDVHGRALARIHAHMHARRHHLWSRHAGGFNEVEKKMLYFFFYLDFAEAAVNVFLMLGLGALCQHGWLKGNV